MPLFECSAEIQRQDHAGLFFVLKCLANAYRVKGMQVGNKLTYDQYAVLGQIYSELVK